MLWLGDSVEGDPQNICVAKFWGKRRRQDPARRMGLALREGLEFDGIDGFFESINRLLELDALVFGEFKI